MHLRLPAFRVAVNAALALVLALGTMAAPAQGTLNVTVVDAITGMPMSNLDVMAMERVAGGGSVARAAATTDAQGRATYVLQGLGTGKTFYLLSNPFNVGWVNSEDLFDTGTYDFLVGRLQVTVRNGVGAALPGKPVYVGRQQPDGTVGWVQSVVTDAGGQLRLDAPGLDRGGSAVVLAATSPLTGEMKLRAPITGYGTHDFVVGRDGLTVNVTNAVSGEPLSGVLVTAMERMTDGSSLGRAQAIADGQGHVSFDLDGLGAGRTYYLLADPYGGGAVESSDVATTGTFSFQVGKLEVAVRSGVDGSPLASTDVLLGEEQSDGSVVWVRGVRTDASGLLRLDPPGLGSGGAAVVLAAISPVDGTFKRRAAISSPGVYDFTVGGAGLEVSLVNALTGAPLPATRIVAFERLDDGTRVWRGDTVTDATGIARFDLPGLDAGRPHYLTSAPYSSGWVDSPDISTTGAFLFQVGSVPVTLIDDATGAVLPGRELAAVRKLPGGVLVGAASGTTDDTGTVHFDPTGLDSGAVYLVFANNPLGLGRQHFSAPITSPGAVSFRVSPEGDASIDLTPPSLAIVAPGDNTVVASAGFRIHGNSSDDNALMDAAVTVDDPVLGSSTVAATLDTATGEWAAQIPATAVTRGQTVGLVVSVRDTYFNRTEQPLQVRVVEDASAPVLTISSHTSGQSVPTTGFIVSGNVTDDTAVQSLTATLTHSVLGITVDGHELEHAPDTGRWSFAVPSAAVLSTGNATVLIQALDDAGNLATANVTLQVTPRDLRARQLINRITFGATPSLSDEVSAIGPEQFLAGQLDPDGLDDALLEAQLPSDPPADILALRRLQITRAAMSRRQLREVMTVFWENHFNTAHSSHGVVDYEYRENLAFRTNALGRFRDLLEISAKSPAMLIFLDGVNNLVGAPNENYARELMELHTIGVESGFTQEDVNEAARAFTGWSVAYGDFRFLPHWHDDGEKVVMGQVFPAGGGISDGESLLDSLAEHPSTASNICRKLARNFVSDTPSTSLVEGCASVFMLSSSAPDQIAQTLEYLLTSSEFEAPENYRVKIKAPLQFTLGLVRNFSATGCCDALPDYLSIQGVDLFDFPSPTGPPITGGRWLNTSRMLKQVYLLQLLAYGDPAYTPVDLDPVTFFRDLGFETAEGIVSYLLDLVFDGEATDLERATAFNILDPGAGYSFWLGAPDAQQRLRRLLATVLAFPSYQYQ